MAHRKNPPSSLFPLRASFAERAATGVAYVVSPLMLPLVLVGLVLGHFGAPPGEMTVQMALAFVFFGLVPLLYLVRLVREDRVRTLEVRDRTRRTRPFLVGTGSAALGTGAAVLAGATAVPLVAALLGCITVNAALLMAVTWRWKISIHAAAVAGFVAMLLFVALVPWETVTGSLLSPGGLAVLVLLVPLVMWARVRSRAHTVAQVWGGAVFGVAAPFVELLLLRQAGVFAGL